MGRPEVQVPDGPLREFAEGLRDLRMRTPNGLTYRAMAAITRYSSTALADAASGRRLPSLPITQAYVRACGGDVEEWTRQWRRLDHQMRGGQIAPPVPETSTLATGVPSGRRVSDIGVFVGLRVWHLRQRGHRVRAWSVGLSLLALLATASLTVFSTSWLPSLVAPPSKEHGNEPGRPTSGVPGDTASPRAEPGDARQDQRFAPHQERKGDVPSMLGKPDFGGYCRVTGQGGVTLVARNAYGWHCSKATEVGDDANDVCAWTFGLRTDQVTNRVADFYDQNSWQCWRINRMLGLLDFSAYCRIAHHANAIDTPALFAYGWQCADSNGRIDPQAACLTLFGHSPPISRFQNFFDKDTWQCWG